MWGQVFEIEEKKKVNTALNATKDENCQIFFLYNLNNFTRIYLFLLIYIYIIFLASENNEFHPSDVKNNSHFVCLFVCLLACFFFSFFIFPKLQICMGQPNLIISFYYPMTTWKANRPEYAYISLYHHVDICTSSDVTLLPLLNRNWWVRKQTMSEWWYLFRWRQWVFLHMYSRMDWNELW